MPELVNFTPFAATTFGVLDKYAHQFDVVVVSATFEALPGKPLRLADEQQPVRDADQYFGEPGLSSVRYEGEIATEKPFVDLLINGYALAPPGRKVGTLTVGVSVGELRKTLQVSGDRFWRTGLRGMGPSSPKPFERMPIIYERAFGGVDDRGTDRARQVSDLRNPVGVGLEGAPSRRPDIATEVPNIEYPSQLIESQHDRPEPAGFGVVGRNTMPRRGFAGTYDENWIAQQRPLLPLDFDVRHFQAAPLDQQSVAIQGGESVEIRNMTPEGVWQFNLPILDVPILLWPADRGTLPTLRLDTVLLEPEFYRVTMLARAKILVLRNQAPLEEIILGHVVGAWWRARLRGKTYLDFRGIGQQSVDLEAFRR
jgi:hypothetical protein